MPELWFGPNIGSLDLLDLFRHPELWSAARSHLSVVQLYEQQIRLEAPDPDARNGPNHWLSLSEVDAWRCLANWGRGLAIEIGAIKWGPSAGACTAQDNQVNALRAIDRVTSSGGRVAAIAIDEALVSGVSTEPQFGCGLTFDRTVEYTARFIQHLRDAHPDVQIGVVEALPANDAALIIRFMEGLQQAGASPSFLHLDVDRYGIRDKNIRADQFARDLRWLQGECAAWRIPFGVILWGQRVRTPDAYCDDVLRWLQRLHGALGGWPDRLIVQSWEEVDGANTLPPNLPESDPDSHTGLICAVQREVAAT